MSNRLLAQKFTCTSCNDDCYPAIKGSIRLVNNSIKECCGHLVSICPDGSGWAVIVLDVPGQGGRVPIVCPDSLLEEKAIKAIKMKVNSESYHKKPSSTESRKNTEKISVKSTAASCMGVQGNLLTDGPNNIKGRVVDDDMLDALEKGCLRRGTDSTQSFYTLDRRFSKEKNKLLDVALMAVESHDGVPKICPAGRSGVDILLRLGESAIFRRLVYHQAMSQAIQTLDGASKLPPPSLDDQLLQISIGGNPKLLQMGRFLPCQRMKDNPDVAVRCACGYVVQDLSLPKDKIRQLLRRQCNRKR